MSELPQIDPAKLAQKLLNKNTELTYQITQLEVLAEALRDERDRAENERDAVKDALTSLQAEIAASAPSETIEGELVEK